MHNSIGNTELANAHNVFVKWFGEHYDLVSLDSMMAAAACHHLDGDPPWLLILSGSGNTKTETVMSLSNVTPHVISTINGEAALLSGSPRRESGPDATGGLLREVGHSGILVIKDFTSILSMNRDTRGQVLSALREIYDGRWIRRMGADGGRILTWEGRLIVIGAVTSAYDRAHAVIAKMGERFALVRTDSADVLARKAAQRQAMANIGQETHMRTELAEAVSKCLQRVHPELASVDRDTAETLGDLANLVTLAKTAVERDYKGDVISADAPEMPTRFTKILGQIVRGSLALGMSRDRALQIATRVAGDSMPPLRLAILRHVDSAPGHNVTEISRAMDINYQAVNRECQALHILGMVSMKEGTDTAERRYWLSDQIDREALRILVTRNVGR